MISDISLLCAITLIIKRSILHMISVPSFGGRFRSIYSDGIHVLIIVGCKATYVIALDSVWTI